jgi:hypothetical protein
MAGGLSMPAGHFHCFGRLATIGPVRIGSQVNRFSRKARATASDLECTWSLL